jgi:hypothetical protein
MIAKIIFWAICNIWAQHRRFLRMRPRNHNFRDLPCQVSCGIHCDYDTYRELRINWGAYPILVCKTDLAFLPRMLFHGAVWHSRFRVGCFCAATCYKAHLKNNN